jgi:hypothetical protein
MYKLGDTFLGGGVHPFYIGKIENQANINGLGNSAHNMYYIVTKKNLCRLTLPKLVMHKYHSKDNFKISRIILTEKAWKYSEI